MLVMLVALAGCGFGDSANGPATPTPSSNALVPLDLGLPPEALNAPVSGMLPDNQRLHIEVTFKIDQAALDQLEQKNVAKPGDTISAADLANKFGISEQDFQRAKAFFGIENATVKLDATRTSMTVDAQAGSVARALQTKFVVHTLDKRTFFTPDPKQMPRVPAVIAGKILAVTGLENYSLPPEHRASSTPLSAQKGQAAAGCEVLSRGVSPSAVARAYGFDQLWKAGWRGEGMTINLVEIDTFNPADVAYYGSCVGARNPIKTVTVGEAPEPGGETTLDLEMIMGLAPRANLVVYQSGSASFQAVNAMLRQIINDNAQNKHSAGIVSISLGASETGIGRSNFSAIDQSIQILTKALHMTVFVASGDCGAFTTRVYGRLSVSFPANDPYVVAVGGTMVQGRGAQAQSVVWSDGSNKAVCRNQWGSGGGLSQFFKQPDWQTGVGVTNKYSTGYRQVPDVAAIADNLPIFYRGKWYASGGTSAAAPIWAAGMALVNQGLINQKGLYYFGPRTFYLAANTPGNLHPFRDITGGNNLYYNASTGWDYATGWGEPSLPDFYRVLSNNADAS
ncbi:MAG: S8 family serine peptidase [Ktedonobacteraceae bacterium]|nr:S8 family serine peptidase [Ktedonobacteraceae bacterium]